MSQSEESKPQSVQFCPEHHTRLRATIRENWYRCKRCKALWVFPNGNGESEQVEKRTQRGECRNVCV